MRLSLNDIKACPWLIFAPDHYRDDGTCRCDDPSHINMANWGYKWNNDTKRWE